jgi:hypothetical protein
MRGIVWSALGQGLKNLGDSTSRIFERQIEREERLKEEGRRDQRILDAEQRKEEREAARTEALKKRVSTESAQVESRAAEIGGRRTAAALDADAAKLGEMSAKAGEEGDIAFTKEQMLEMLRKDPALRESYQKSGLIDGASESKRDARLTRAEDRVTAAMEIGAHSSVLEAYSKARSETLREIAEENRQKKSDAAQASTDRRLDQQDERLRMEGEKTTALVKMFGQKGDAATKNADTAATRAANAGNKPAVRDAPTERLTTQAETLRKAAKEATGERKKTLESELDEVLAELKRRRQGAPAPAPAGAAAQSGTVRRDYSNLWK